MTKSPITSFTQGDETWRDLRRRCTVSVPGKYSSLYYLNAFVLSKANVIPMTYRAHWAMCLFAEGMTGIKEIDSAPRRMVLVPRGVGKSSLLTTAMPIHRLIRNKDDAVGIANEVQTNAEKFLGSIKLEFERNDLLRALFPEVCPADTGQTTWKVDEIVVNRSRPRIDPSIRAIGVGGTATGAHPNCWILDDILSKNAANAARTGNFAEIEKVNQWVVELEPMLSAPATDLILLIGTYWWINDTYQWIEGDEDVNGHWGHGEKRQTHNWTLKLPDGTYQTHKVYRRGDLSVFCRDIYDGVGDSFFPEKLPNEYLQTKEQEDPAFFASQYRLSPAAGAAADFKDHWLQYYALDGQNVRFVDKDGQVRYAPFNEITFTLSIDPAFSKKGDACRTAMPVTGVWEDYIFLMDDFAERGLGVQDIADKAVSLCMAYPVTKIIMETITAQVALVDPVKKAIEKARLGQIIIDEIPSHGNQRKAVRILGMEPFFRNRKFYTRGEHTNFKNEYISFPRSSHRDLLDALSFQRSEWERIIRFGGKQKQSEVSDHISNDLNRLRRTFSRR